MPTLIELDLDRILAAPEPWAALADERERGWIAASPYGLHVLTFEAAFDLLRDRRFNPDVRKLIDGAGISNPTVRTLWRTALLGSEPADHDRLRRVVVPYFTKQAIAELRDFVVDLTERLARPIATWDVFDAVEAFSARIPPAVFTRMIGAPEAHAEQIGAWSMTILQIFARRPELAPQIERATQELLGYVDEFIAARRIQSDGGDMISTLLAAEDRGDRLSTPELRAIVLESLEASTDNTASALATVLYAAALHPDHWQELRRDRRRIPSFVEEVGRLWPRIVHISRSAKHDVEWRQVSIPAGTELLVSVPSALRDPAIFGEPQRFDPNRDTPTSNNLNFGSGSHHCIGAALARMEMNTALEVLARQWEHIELAGTPRIAANIGVTTVEYLPLRVTPLR